jgi:CheY-like chemotaxis protein
MGLAVRLSENIRAGSCAPADGKARDHSPRCFSPRDLHSKAPCLSRPLAKNQNFMERTVLVVEDDRELAGVLADALSEYGYRVECAHDGVVALARASEQRPAAIILDLLMPEMDGLAFLGTRRDNSALSDIPVIVLTGQRGMTHEARALDADVVLEKPVKLLMLVEAIHRVVDARSRRLPDA